MIEFHQDNLLEADVEALVNTVNTVGIMGKGIALQFKKTFPENFKAYERACKEGRVEIGRMFTVPLSKLTNPRYIINFPTKRHWREKSRLEYVSDGLEDLLHEVERLNLHSIAVPPLGCGNGGLDWKDEVRPLIETAFAQAPHVQVHAYEPSPDKEPVSINAGGARPDLTTARAVMLWLVGAYKDSHYALGRLATQKLAYLAQAAGEYSLRLEFKEYKFGPYAENLNHLLQALEGHYIAGYGDRSGKSDINLLPGAEQMAEDFLSTQPETRRRLEKVARLMEGFETPYGMELLATVHWAVDHNGAAVFEEALQAVRDWNPRKEELFSEQHIAIAWERLDNEGWIISEPAVQS